MGLPMIMEQGGILQHGMPISSDFPSLSDQDCIESFQAHPHHSPYTNGGAVDPIRRDGCLPQPAFNLATKNANGARFVSHGGIASDGSSYRSGNNFSDSNSGSISTSPSSQVSSVYNPYQPNHYTSLPAFSNAVTLPQTFGTPSYAGIRVPSMSESSTESTPVMPPPSIGLNPLRSPIPAAANTNDRESYAHPAPFLAGAQLSPSGYRSYPDTPRIVNSVSGLTLSPGTPYHPSPMAASSPQSYQNAQNGDCSNFPWPNLEVLLEMTCEGSPVTPEIHAKVEKGFFLAPVDQKWTCYRRNYFSVNASFELHPHINNGRVHLKRDNGAEQVQAMGMRLSAAIDAPGGKPIELIQHTPKRDAGPKNKIDVVKVSPATMGVRQEHTLSHHGVYQIGMPTFHATGAPTGPHFPYQNDPSGASSSIVGDSRHFGGYGAPGSHMPLPGQSTNHTFERVQFKQATANNGKRRASQQYFHLVIELFADVRKDGSDKPAWVKVAQRVSDKIVVRGRSPSHYQNEGQHTGGGRGTGSHGGSGGYSSGGGMGYGGHNPGAFRTSNGGYSGSLSSSNGYRSNNYGLQMSSGDSASSPESVGGGANEPDNPMDISMSDADRGDLQDMQNYCYHPGPLGPDLPNQLPLPKIESSPRYSTEPRQYAVKAEFADTTPGPNHQLNGCPRFDSMDSSRGFFNDMPAAVPTGYT